jgi:hypothetical protein
MQKIEKETQGQKKRKWSIMKEREVEEKEQKDYEED